MPGTEQLLGIIITPYETGIRGDFIKTTSKKVRPDFIRLDPYFKDALTIKSGDRVEFNALNAPEDFVTTFLSGGELIQRSATTTEATALMVGVTAFRRGSLTSLEVTAREILEDRLSDWFTRTKGEMHDRYKRELELVLGW